MTLIHKNGGIGDIETKLPGPEEVKEEGGPTPNYKLWGKSKNRNKHLIISLHFSVDPSRQQSTWNQI